MFNKLLTKSNIDILIDKGISGEVLVVHPVFYSIHVVDLPPSKSLSPESFLSLLKHASKSKVLLSSDSAVELMEVKHKKDVSRAKIVVFNKSFHEKLDVLNNLKNKIYLLDDLEKKSDETISLLFKNHVIIFPKGGSLGVFSKKSALYKKKKLLGEQELVSNLLNFSFDKYFKIGKKSWYFKKSINRSKSLLSALVFTTVSLAAVSFSFLLHHKVLYESLQSQSQENRENIERVFKQLMPDTRMVKPLYQLKTDYKAPKTNLTGRLIEVSKLLEGEYSLNNVSMMSSKISFIISFSDLIDKKKSLKALNKRYSLNIVATEDGEQWELEL